MRLRKKIQFDPMVNNVMLEAFQQMVINNVTDKWEKVTRKQWEALQSIKNDDTIVLNKADKGGAVVLIDRNQYVQEAMHQLSDNNMRNMRN